MQLHTFKALTTIIGEWLQLWLRPLLLNLDILTILSCAKRFGRSRERLGW